MSEFRIINNTFDPSSDAVEIRLQQNLRDLEFNKLQNQKEKLLQIKENVENGNLYIAGLDLTDSKVLISESDKNVLDSFSKLKGEISRAKLKFQPDSIKLRNLEEQLIKLEPIKPAPPDIKIFI